MTFLDIPHHVNQEFFQNAELRQIPVRTFHAQKVDLPIILPKFAAQYLRSLHRNEREIEQLPAKKKPLLTFTVYGLKTSSFEQDKKQHKPVSIHILPFSLNVYEISKSCRANIEEVIIN